MVTAALESFAATTQAQLELTRAFLAPMSAQPEAFGGHGPGWNDAFLRLLEAAPGAHRGGPTPGGPQMKDMARVFGGPLPVGSDDFYPQERPVHEVTVDGFLIDHHPVTNAEFRRFVKATGYLTVAEQAPDPADYPDADPALLVPGGLVFQPEHRAG